MPDTVGLTVEEALEALHSAGVMKVELVRTQPPSRYRKSKGHKTNGEAQTDVVRVIAQRVDGDKIKLIVSAEAYIQPYRRFGGRKDDESQAGSCS